MVFHVLLLLFTATTLQYTEAKVEWISRPRSRLFVNAGETARINWKFPAGAMAVTYEKKTTISGDGTRIAYKQDAAEPVILDDYKDKIKIHKSGALSILKAGLNDEGYYFINIVYKSNTLDDEVKIEIQEAPVITTFPTHTKSEVFYMGMTINLLCMARGRPVAEVQWFKDGMDKPLQKSTGSILYQINSAAKEDSGRYTCLATNQAGKANRSIEYIFFRRPYDVDFVHNTALDGTIYEGESVIFTCYAKGNPPIDRYKLLHNGQEISRIRSSNGIYLIKEVKHKDNGTYTCIPINKAGLGENETVALKVQGRPGYWEEKRKRTTPLPTEKAPVSVITEHVDTSEQLTTEILRTRPKEGRVSGAGNIVGESVVLLSLLLILFN